MASFGSSGPVAVRIRAACTDDLSVNFGKCVEKVMTTSGVSMFFESWEAADASEYLCTVRLVQLNSSTRVSVSLVGKGMREGEHKAILTESCTSVQLIVKSGEFLKFNHSTLEDLAAGRTHLAKMFSRKFLHRHREPRTLTKLKEAVNAVWEGRTKYYSPCVNVLQSSGTGKTRAVVALAQGESNGIPIPLFYICHRPPKQTGYPHGTEDIFTFLHNPDPTPTGNADEVDLQFLCRYYAFFLSVQDLATKFDPCGEFWKKGYWTGGWDMEKIHTDEATILEHLKRCKPENQNAEAAAWLARRLKGKQGPNKVCFFVLFDECRHFRAMPKHIAAKSDPLLLMTRAARWLWDLGGVMFTMDTLPETVDVPISVWAPSSRTAPEGTKLMIFTDLLNSDLECRQAKTVGTAVSAEHVLSMGRPLWSAALEGNPSTKYVFDFIEGKLLCDSRPAAAESLTAAQAAAILCSRVGLDPNPHQNLSKELVGSHLAHLNHFDPAKGYVLCGYPSDPAIACAARQIWRDEALLAAAINHIFKFMRTRELQRREGGEIASQILMLMVADKLAEEKGIYTVREFLTELLFARTELLERMGTNFANERLSSLDDLLQYLHPAPGEKKQQPVDPRQRVSERLQKQTKDAHAQDEMRMQTEREKREREIAAHQCVLDGVMNLTQFVKISYQPSVGDLMVFFSRGCGVIYPDSCVAVNLLVPVVLRDAYDLYPNVDSQPTAWGPKAAPVSGVKATRKPQAVGEKAVHVLSAQVAELGMKGGGVSHQPPKQPVGADDTQARRAALPILPEAMTFLAASAKNCSQDQLYNEVYGASASLVKGLGSTTPYVVVGMYFTDKVNPVVYALNTPRKSERQGLRVAVNNAYHLCSDASDALRAAFHDLVSQLRDPVAYLPEGVDVSSQLSGGVLYYGSLQDVDDVNE